MSTPWLFLCFNIKIKRGLWKINELCKICVIQFRIRTSYSSFPFWGYPEICQIATSTARRLIIILEKIQNINTAVFRQLNVGQILSSQQLATFNINA